MVPALALVCPSRPRQNYTPCLQGAERTPSLQAMPLDCFVLGRPFDNPLICSSLRLSWHHSSLSLYLPLYLPGRCCSEAATVRPPDVTDISRVLLRFRQPEDYRVENFSPPHPWRHPMFRNCSRIGKRIPHVYEHFRCSRCR